MAQDWSYGYVSEIDYTHGYYREISPHRLRFATLVARQKTALSDAPTYLELGFGQGHSLNIHAATNPGTFWGTDFNAAQAASARENASASGADLTLLEASFEELAARDDLPDFDVIALHGIWTWISRENHQVVVDLARRKLKPGGIFYTSYNVTPGWSPAMPLRHIMKEHATRASTGGLVKKLDAAIDFTQSLVDAGALYFKANPAVQQRLEKLKDQQKNYLAHEYLNDSWDVMPFSQAAGHLAEAKLGFACSAHLQDLVDAINLTPDGQKLLAEIDDPIFRQTVRDYLVNQQFRRDIFVKGVRFMAPWEQASALRRQPFALLIQPEDRPEKVAGALGDAELNADVYAPIIETLAADQHRPKTIDQMMADERCKGLNLAQIGQALTILCGNMAVAPAHDDKTFQQVVKTSQALNRELCRKAEFSSDVAYLAAPLIGAGISANRFEQLFLRAADLKQNDAPAWVWSLLKQQGQKIIIEGKTLESDEENLAELRTRHDTFTQKRLPIFKRLGIA